MSDLLILAQRIVRSTDTNLTDEFFHTNSPVYKASNEIVSSYDKYLVGTNALCVVGSCDQIFGLVLNGVKRIDAFDISRFAICVMYLKIASIMSLSREEYIDMYYGSISYDEKYDDYYYQKIRNYLSLELRKFWDGLFDYNDWMDIYNSTLFSSEPALEKVVVKRNKYLQGEYYYDLRDKLMDAVINPLNCNIMDLYQVLFKKEYDLIYLSNIMAYNDQSEFKKMLLSKKKETLILNYIFCYEEVIKNFYNEEQFEIENINDSDNALLLVK